MSLYIDFEPHSWYKGFAIRKVDDWHQNTGVTLWVGLVDNGNTYQVDEVTGRTLKELKKNITSYRSK